MRCRAALHARLPLGSALLVLRARGASSGSLETHLLIGGQGSGDVLQLVLGARAVLPPAARARHAGVRATETAHRMRCQVLHEAGARILPCLSL